MNDYAALMKRRHVHSLDAISTSWSEALFQASTKPTASCFCFASSDQCRARAMQRALPLDCDSNVSTAVKKWSRFGCQSPR
jgi:hypothetical protein